MEGVGQERDETEEPQQAGHGALDGALAPLPLCREAEMTTGLLKRHLNHPSTIPLKRHA